MRSNSTSPVLKVENLSVGFGQDDDTTWVTKDINFEVLPGKTLAIVGESGSGKSVSAMAVLDLLPQNAVKTGHIRFGEEDLVAASAERLRQIRGNDIAMIFQEPMTALNPVYTVGKQIADALGAHERSAVADKHKRVVELLELVGIPEPARRAKSFPHQLSGGQRQRAMIAIAISKNPSVLIADEPTTALDVTVQLEILRLLKKLQLELDMALVLITHDMGVVAEMADDVVVMNQGEVVERADTFSLFASPSHEYTRALLDAVPKRQEFPETVDDSESESVSGPSAALSVDSLHVRYPGKWGRTGFLAIEDVTFSIPRGEILGLVGESGSGKSTIGKAVVGLAPVEEGSITVNGIEAVGADRRQISNLRQQYGMVFQDPASSLNPRTTIGDSIAEPLVVQRRGMSFAERRDRVAEMLSMVKISPDWSSRYPHELSGGQRQRIGIARALVLEPSVLIADEPTSALDVSVQAAVLEILQELQERLRFSCLFISHDLAVVEILADQVGVLQHGKLVELGATRDVLRDPQQEYTRRLIDAAPVPDPEQQRTRFAEKRA